MTWMELTMDFHFASSDQSRDTYFCPDFQSFDCRRRLDLCDSGAPAWPTEVNLRRWRIIVHLQLQALLSNRDLAGPHQHGSVGEPHNQVADSQQYRDWSVPQNVRSRKSKQSYDSQRVWKGPSVRRHYKSYALRCFYDGETGEEIRPSARRVR